MAEVLNAQLGAWVQDLDAEALKIGVWSGQIVLENLQARATAPARVHHCCAWRARSSVCGSARFRPGHVARTLGAAGAFGLTHAPPHSAAPQLRPEALNALKLPITVTVCASSTPRLREQPALTRESRVV